LSTLVYQDWRFSVLSSSLDRTVAMTRAADLLEQPEHIGLDVFFDDLPAGQR